MTKPPGAPPSHDASSDSVPTRVAIRTSGAPAKSAITAQAVCAGGFVFTAGVIPLDPDTHQLPSGDITTPTGHAQPRSGAAGGGMVARSARQGHGVPAGLG